MFRRLLVISALALLVTGVSGCKKSETGATSSQKEAASPQSSSPDGAIADARRALWSQSDNREVAAQSSEIVYQMAMKKGTGGLQAGDLDTALDAAEVAVAHRPQSPEARDLLSKSRAAIKAARPYFGRHLGITIKQITAPPYPWGGLKLYLSPDGKSLVCAFEKDVAVCNLESGKVTAQDFAHNGGIYSPATGAVIIASRLPNYTRRVSLSGDVVWNLPDIQLGLLGFSPDGGKFASRISDMVQVRNSETGDIISSVPIQAGSTAWWGGFSGDGKLGALQTQNGNWLVFDAGTGKVIQTLTGHPGYTASFGAKDRFAYSSDIETSIVDTRNWKNLVTIGSAAPCEFADGGKILGIGASPLDSRSTFYDGNTGQKLSGPFNALSGAPLSVSDDGSRIIGIGASGEILVFNVNNGKAAGSVPPLHFNPTAVTVVPDGRIFGYNINGQIAIYSPPEWPNTATINTLPPHSIKEQWAIMGMGLTPDDPEKADAVIADLKRTYGIDIVVTVPMISANPVPRGLDGIALVNTDPAAETVQYLHDQELMNGAPGFYMCFAATSKWIWEWYPGASNNNLLSADDIKKLGALLEERQPTGQEIRRFLANLQRTLKEKHPEITGNGALSLKRG